MRASFDTLLRLAALSRTAADDGEFERGLDALDNTDVKLLWFAVKVLEGGAVKLTTATPERYREFAEHVGATLEEITSTWPGAGSSSSGRLRRSEPAAGTSRYLTESHGAGGRASGA